jgi:hypothetical protein
MKVRIGIRWECAHSKIHSLFKKRFFKDGIINRARGTTGKSHGHKKTGRLSEKTPEGLPVFV